MIMINIHLGSRGPTQANLGLVHISNGEGGAESHVIHLYSPYMVIIE